MRRLLLIVLACVVSTGFVALFNERAWAGGANYVGAAPPSVSCSVTVGLHFIPAITRANPTPRMTKVNGIVSPCVATTHGIGFTGKAHITPNMGNPFNPNPGFCGGGGSGGAFSIGWKGTFNGSIGAQQYTGTAHFVPSVVGPETPTL